MTAPFILAFKPMGNFRFTSYPNLTNCTFLDYGRKTEYPEKLSKLNTERPESEC